MMNAARARSGAGTSRYRGSYLLALPYVAFNSVLWVYPFGWAVFISTFLWRMISPSRTFIGLGNYLTALRSPVVRQALFNSLHFMLVFIPVVLAGSIILALLINRIRHLKGLFISGFLLSYISSGVAFSVVFMLLFSGDGIVNRFLGGFGLRIPWFSDTRMAMTSIALIVAWKFIGYYGLIFLAGLQGIPETVYEAAEIDGAGGWTRFWHITLPLLNPAITAVVVFAAILSFNIFTEPYLITSGGPAHSTHTLLMEVYYQSFQALNSGYGSALAVSTTALTFIFVFFVRRLVEREAYL